MDKKTFDVLNKIKEMCSKTDCKDCKFYDTFLGCFLEEIPSDWDMSLFENCSNCAEYYNGRCIHYKEDVAASDSCSFFYFKKGDD